MPPRSLAVVLMVASGCASVETEGAIARAWASAPIQTTTVSVDAARPLDRAAIVAWAIESSPAIAALTHRARARVHAARAEAALPPAELAAELWNLPLARPYALDEADMGMIELRQRFPAAGARDARARGLIEEAEAALAERTRARREVAARAWTALAELDQAEAEAALLAEQQALLERMGEAVRARYSTGGAALSEAARIEAERARALRSRARVAGARTAALQRLDVLLGRAPDAAPLTPLTPLAAPVETTTVTVEGLLALTEARGGAVVAAGARARAATARRDAADAEARWPEVMVGVGYWQQPGERPGLGLSAAITLPWLWGAAPHLAEQAREEELAEQDERAREARDARGEVVEAHARLRALEQELRVLRAQAVPAARRARVAQEAAYATGSAGLLDWLEAARAALEVELELAALRGELARALAALERAAGVELPRAPISGDAP